MSREGRSEEIKSAANPVITTKNNSICNHSTADAMETLESPSFPYLSSPLHVSLTLYHYINTSLSLDFLANHI